MNKNPIICVDFDGVIHSYTSGWGGISTISDPPVPGAIEWIMTHLPIPEALGGSFAPEYKGPEVQIYSARSKSFFGRWAMKRWLIKWGLPRAYISEGVLKFPTKKPAAFLTIDDRAICFNGFFPATHEMMSFKPWYKSRAVVDPDQFVDSFLAEVRAELLHARMKFPGDRIMTIALAEEFGELAKAILEEPSANVRKEAVQTATMAARVCIDGDGSVNEWRQAKGLDVLTAASKVAL